MTTSRLKDLLARVQGGTLSVEEALESLKTLPFEDLGFAKIDHHRTLRKGFPEVILGQGKEPGHIVEIARRLVEKGQPALITRLDEEAAVAVSRMLPGLRYYRACRLALLGEPPLPPTGQGTILVVSAGTADLPVAEEAALTAEMMGNRVDRLYDV
ncbi:MAG: 1-(5-phosphoribosyl)-5-amino-4-imidazole-carboxylate carboxylase, partial [Deltaproteobacteria bacterium]|nr:1-(5-phosphoribosyl)-5-amino-4-imidazole-carboxylate carboxylase [Deltaproteobacteria bacterium]